MSGTQTGLAPGTLLDGKYEIVGLLGVGGMGEVYKARHVHLGAFRCIKVVKPSLLADEAYRTRFLREARMATQIHHPNLAAVHDFSILDDGTSYMVAEFIDGTTVRQWETANGRFPMPLATEVTMQVLAGLDHIHRRGLLHRDISADNVMLSFDADEHLLVKIIDLGVAKDVRTSSDVDTTQAGVFMGNPKYMSPEQLGELEEGESLDGRTDLYSLGVVLYEMLTGVPPFVARTPNLYIVKHLTQAPRTFQEADPTLDLPAAVEAIVMRALEKDRTRRHASARAFAETLAPFVAKSPVAFARTGVPIAEKPVEPPRIDVEAENAWNAAVAADTYSSYRDFRTRFPKHRAGEAERALTERLAFDGAAAFDTEEAWSVYLEAWAGDRHAPEAIQRREAARVREETAYSVAMEMKSPVAWQAYLDEFPDSDRAADAENHLRESLAYAEARKADSTASLGLFLLNHPAGLHEYDARERLSMLETAEERRALARQAIVEGDFNAAFETGTVEAWDAWLAAYPQAPMIADARRARDEAAQFELASNVDTKVMWRAFLKAWPHGRHNLDAELKLRS
ncbi:MAG TPA: serine/threonine-protein kinase [Thermoanaerobaculia bacterium]|jgi:tRNA A-37 threonylcarbamoyl transferase component Bud32|nr:serine/threonine-protein kinase [Thermoanaerobaculia bacterium]